LMLRVHDVSHDLCVAHGTSRLPCDIERNL
jgi:hypothetical protein